jgi:hypothetical protein
LRKDPARSGESFMAKVREEMVLIALEGSRTGTLFRYADIFIQNVLEMNEKKVSDVAGLTGSQQHLPEAIRFQADEPVGSVKKKVSDQQPAILVYDSVGEKLCGYVPLWELVGTPDDLPIGTFCKKLPQLESDQSILTAIRSVIDDDSCFYSIVDGTGTTTAVADSVTMLRGAFHKTGKNSH